MSSRSIIAALALLALLAACSDRAGAPASGPPRAGGSPGGGPGGGRMATAVSALEVATAPYAPRLVVLGTVAPLQTVDVRSRVEGEITRVLFEEGDTVKAGQTLFQIDDRLAQSQLASARAQLATAEANLVQAEAELRRAEALVEKGFISGSILDQRRALERAARAAVNTGKAAVRNAETNLSFFTIRAPVSGRTGELRLRLGATVRQGEQQALVTINQLSPISVRFLVPPQDIQQVRMAMRAGGVTVEARTQGADGRTPPLARGRLVFLDNNVDPGTGSVVAKAEFANPDDVLWPGGIVSVSMPMGPASEHVALPESAVQTGRDSPFVWLIGADDTVSIRDVKVLGRADGTVFLAEGLQPGERVVADALARLKAGDRVRTVGPGAAAVAAGAAPGRAG